ncbi:uncharacterized protein [Diadema setosum]|uniref:uncharacterized protein n=1 Tax=Diadema setosum TaxID=31175 RepID=UPI003B3BDAA3
MSRPKTPDIAKMANTVPRFDEEDVDSFFFSFERIARNLEWEKKYWSMIVQQKLTGKAHSVVSALSDGEANDYDTVKEAVLLAYQLVPEAYRQKFRGYRRGSRQTYVEFQREKEIMFDRWVRSMKVDLTYENLREIVLMEEFKKSTPPDLRTYLEDRRVHDVKSAAVTADQYELTHKSQCTSRKLKNSSMNSQKYFQHVLSQGFEQVKQSVRERSLKVKFLLVTHSLER